MNKKNIIVKTLSLECMTKAIINSTTPYNLFSGLGLNLTGSSVGGILKDLPKGEASF